MGTNLVYLAYEINQFYYIQTKRTVTDIVLWKPAQICIVYRYIKTNKLENIRNYIWKTCLISQIAFKDDKTI